MSSDCLTCGALGCTDAASYRLDTDEYGERVLCNNHAHEIGGTVVDHL